MRTREYDLVIENALVIDGTGQSPYQADVGMARGKICCIARDEVILGRATIDAEGLVLAPGFIDMHGHSDLDVLVNGALSNKLEQGITTEVAGMCGITMAPVSSVRLPLLMRYLGVSGPEEMPPDLMELWQGFSSFGKYLDAVESRPLGANLAACVGHGTVRLAVMGFDDRSVPTRAELDAMKDLVREAMAQGAVGMSSGLIYAPGVYAQRDEIVELCKLVCEYGGLYATHMRNESSAVVESVKEAIEVGRQSGVAVLISHHKIAGRVNWGLSTKTLGLIDQANREGVRVFLDQYPYHAGASMLAITIPAEYHAGGTQALLERLKDPSKREVIRAKIAHETTSWENMVFNCGWEGIVLSSVAMPQLNGKSLQAVARELDKDPYDALFDVLVESAGKMGATYHLMGDEDIERIMAHPLTMIGTDSGVNSTHPRGSGTFPRVLGHFVREKKTLTLEEAIRKMTSMPAAVAGLKNKGIVAEGYDADLVLFDAAAISDTADYRHPARQNKGIRYVLVNGEIAVAENKYTGATSGRVLR